MQTLVKWRVMQHFIWLRSSLFAKVPVYGFSVYKGLIELPIIVSWTSPFLILVYLGGIFFHFGQLSIEQPVSQK